MGTVLDGKSITKISGESVFVYISGGSLSSSVSGQSIFVYISGGSISATISGEIIVDISGSVVDISGSVVVAEVSGQTVVSEVSGQTVVAEISGQIVVAEISGQPVFVYISGGSLSASVSGQPVNVSGNSVFVYISGGATSVSGAWVDVSGSTVISKISGQSVYAYLSGGSVNATVGISGHSAGVSNNGAVAISSVVTTAGTYFEWMIWHTTSSATTSSELYATVQQTSSAAFKTKIFSMNLAATSVTDIVFQPDNRFLLLSGAVVTVIYSNPNSLAYGCELMFSD